MRPFLFCGVILTPPLSAPTSGERSLEDVLAIIAMALIWLMPNHQLPWSAFHHELVMGIVLSISFLLAAWQGGWAMPVSPAFIILALLALVPGLQWAVGVLPLSGQAFISSLYIATVALAFAFGHASAKAGDRLFTIVSGGLVLGAALNVPIQVIQWYQWYSMELDSIMLMLVTPINSAQRPSGLILQPNQLATIQVWGLIGLTWLHQKRHIGRSLFVAVFVIIGLGLGITQSRAGLLELIIVASALTMAWWRKEDKFWMVIWWAMVTLQIVWAAEFKAVANFLNVPTEAVARLSSIDGARFDAWRAYWAAALTQPWLGFGVGDLGYAYTTVAADRPEIFIGERFAHSHNALLDLVLWVGFPLATLLLILLAWWILRCMRAVRVQPELVFPLALLMALAIHSMLELPHHFLYFLAPAAICAGYIEHAMLGASPALRYPAWLAAGVAGLVVIVLICLDYFPYQERYTEWRYENARVGTPLRIPVDPPWVLNQIHDEIILYRLDLDSSLDEDKIHWINLVAAAVASPPAYYIAAKANAYLGDSTRAFDWMMRLNAMLNEEDVQLMRRIWTDDQARLSQLKSIDWPPYQGKRNTVKFTPEFVVPKLDSIQNPRAVASPTSNND